MHEVCNTTHTRKTLLVWFGGREGWYRLHKKNKVTNSICNAEVLETTHTIQDMRLDKTCTLGKGVRGLT